MRGATPGGVGGGGTILLFDYTVGVASQAAIDTAIDGPLAGVLRTDLTYLEIYLTGRTDEAINRSNIGWWFNNDLTATDYDRIAISSSSGGSPLQVQVLAGQTTSGTIAGALLAAGVPGMNRCFMPDYSSSVFWKLCEFTSWVTDNTAGLLKYEIGLNAILRESTDPITRIMVTPDTAGAKFVTGTRLSVWAR